MAKITVRKNGSLLVEGDDVTLVDWNGTSDRAAEAPVHAVPMRGVHAKAVLRRHALARGVRRRRGSGASSADRPA